MNTYTAEIKISLRSGILDVQGKAIENSLHSTEFKQISNVKVGKIISLDIATNSKDNAFKIASAAADNLLANPIIEDFSIIIK